MPTTMTLKNIPDEVYERLREAADRHRRSINSEAIVCLEAILLPGRTPPRERVAKARAFRTGQGGTRLKATDIDIMKREGRA